MAGASDLGPVAIVEFASQQEALMATFKLRSSPLTRCWAFKVIPDPQFGNQLDEVSLKRYY